MVVRPLFYERQRGRQADRKTDRHTDRQAGRKMWSDRQIEEWTYRPKEQPYRMTDRLAETGVSNRASCLWS